MPSDEMKAIETRFDGHRFRSRAEARWAVLFKTIGFAYEYEKEGFDLDGEWYLPDFFLPDLGLWVEVKGEAPTDREIELARRLAAGSGKTVLIAVGAPKVGQGQFIVVGNNRVSGGYALLADRRNPGEYWISNTSTFEGFSIGPVDGPSHDRYPLMMEELEKAFDAASSARFEHGERG